MTITGDSLAQRLATEVPQARTVVDDHVRRWGYAGDPYLLMDDIQAVALAMYRDGSRESLARLLAVLADGPVDGDFDVRAAIRNEFIGYLPPWTSEMKPFVATWPPALREEANLITQHMTG